MQATGTQYLVKRTEGALGNVESFCKYYEMMNQFVSRMKIRVSLDRGAFLSADSLLPDEVLETLSGRYQALKSAYGPEAGEPLVRELIAAVENKRHGTAYERKNVICLPGAWTGVELAIEAICTSKATPGLVAVVGPTHYQLFHRAINSFGVELVCFDYVCNRGLCVPTQVDDIEAILASKPDVVVITNPNNPNGCYFSGSLLQYLLKRTAQCGIYVLIDEVQAFFNIEAEGLNYGPWIQQDHVLRVDSASKRYALAEYRVGWMIAHERFIGTRTTGLLGRMSGLMGNAPRAANAALVYLLSRELAGVDLFAQRWAELNTKEQLVRSFLSRFSTIRIHRRDACINLTFSVVLNATDLDFARSLMERGLLLLPCSGYGYPAADTVMRLTFAERDEKLEEGLYLVSQVLENH